MSDDRKTSEGSDSDDGSFADGEPYDTNEVSAAFEARAMEVHVNWRSEGWMSVEIANACLAAVDPTTSPAVRRACLGDLQQKLTRRTTTDEPGRTPQSISSAEGQDSSPTAHVAPEATLPLRRPSAYASPPKRLRIDAGSDDRRASETGGVQGNNPAEVSQANLRAVLDGSVRARQSKAAMQEDAASVERWEAAGRISEIGALVLQKDELTNDMKCQDKSKAAQLEKAAERISELEALVTRKDELVRDWKRRAESSAAELEEAVQHIKRMVELETLVTQKVELLHEWKRRAESKAAEQQAAASMQARDAAGRISDLEALVLQKDKLANNLKRQAESSAAELEEAVERISELEALVSRKDELARGMKRWAKSSAAKLEKALERISELETLAARKDELAHEWKCQTESKAAEQQAVASMQARDAAGRISDLEALMWQKNGLANDLKRQAESSAAELEEAAERISELETLVSRKDELAHEWKRQAESKAAEQQEAASVQARDAAGRISDLEALVAQKDGLANDLKRQAESSAAELEEAAKRISELEALALRKDELAHEWKHQAESKAAEQEEAASVQARQAARRISVLESLVSQKDGLANDLKRRAESKAAELEEAADRVSELETLVSQKNQDAMKLNGQAKSEMAEMKATFEAQLEQAKLNEDAMFAEVEQAKADAVDAFADNEDLSVATEPDRDEKLRAMKKKSKVMDIAAAPILPTVTVYRSNGGRGGEVAADDREDKENIPSIGRNATDDATVAMMHPTVAVCQSFEGGEGNSDNCFICCDGGNLICCDFCDKSFHMKCNVPSLSEIPKGDWKCCNCVAVERKKLSRCGECKACLRSDCHKCTYCLDEPKFGGDNKLKKPCELKVCSNKTYFPMAKNGSTTKTNSFEYSFDAPAHLQVVPQRRRAKPYAPDDEVNEALADGDMVGKEEAGGLDDDPFELADALVNDRSSKEYRYLEEPQGGAVSLQPGMTVLYLFTSGWERGTVQAARKYSRPQKAQAKEMEAPVMLRYTIGGKSYLHDLGSNDARYISEGAFERLRSGASTEKEEDIAPGSWCLVSLG